MVFEMSLRMPT